MEDKVHCCDVYHGCWEVQAEAGPQRREVRLAFKQRTTSGGFLGRFSAAPMAAARPHAPGHSDMGTELCATCLDPVKDAASHPPTQRLQSERVP